MTQINDFYLDLAGSYLFAEIAKRVNAFKQAHPEADVIRLGIGDVTRPLSPTVISALHQAVEEMSSAASFRGYGPEQGYSSLIQKIIQYDFNSHGVELDEDEVFVSDGAKCDTANIQEIFSVEARIALMDPVYPVYSDTNVMAGRAGKRKENGQYERFVYLPSTADNQFNPQLPQEKVDLIYLCFPNNPTGTTLKKAELKRWVDYAKEQGAIILFDAAYEAFIQEKDVPHSIYEIEGAKEVAIEFRSFSKTAGFTGTRCAYTVVPKQLFGKTKDGAKQSINALWNRRQTTKFNGVSYIVQKGAEAIYTPEGQQEIKQLIAGYMANAKLIREGLEQAGFEVYGGINAPYIWLKTPNDLSSWAFFDKMLQEAHVVGTPGVGFGLSGEGYYRLTAFGDPEKTRVAVERFGQVSPKILS